MTCPKDFTTTTGIKLKLPCGNKSCPKCLSKLKEKKTWKTVTQ